MEKKNIAEFIAEGVKKLEEKALFVDFGINNKFYGINKDGKVVSNDKKFVNFVNKKKDEK